MEDPVVLVHLFKGHRQNRAHIFLLRMLIQEKKEIHECRDVHSIIRQNGLINYDHYWYKCGKKEGLGDCGIVRLWDVWDLCVCN